MKKIWTIAPVIAAALAATPAYAQATRTWVSGVGDDANPCSRTAPCKTFAGAISKTQAGGEINVLDPGGFGAVTITKSITIRADNLSAGVLVANQNGITINNASARVVLQGLDFEGLAAAPTTPGPNGVNVVAAADVTILDCSINAFSTAGVNVNVASGKTFVTVANTRITGNPVGVLVQSASGRSNVRVVGSTFANNADASIRVSGTGNKVLISNNRMFDPNKNLDLVAGGTATTSSNNALGAPASDTATAVPQG